MLARAGALRAVADDDAHVDGRAEVGPELAWPCALLKATGPAPAAAGAATAGSGVATGSGPRSCSSIASDSL